MSQPPRRKSQPPLAPGGAPLAAGKGPSSPGAVPSSRRKRKRRRTSGKPAPPQRRTTLGALGRGLLAALLVLFAACAPLLIWSWLEGPGGGRAFLVEIPAAATVNELSELLVTRGALLSPRLFRTYVGLFQPGFQVAGGEHLLNDGASPREMVLRLARSPNRPALRVTVPEGFQSQQVGQRLERAEVCSLTAFRAAVSDPALLKELGITGPNAEGYLFPASYGLLLDSDAREVVRVLAREAKGRIQKLFQAHPGRFEQLAHADGFSEGDVITLASMIEKEAQAAEERPLIASVFFNRLHDPEFRPARMLQSDPTASYGCMVRAADIPSCAGFHGAVTPALLRDAANPYNTYRHAGLPPGPIANPGEASIEAVLAPAQSNYLYFVAKGGGHHVFSRTFAEHREAVEMPR
ncbi:MAG: endolytic transglycosylase MltG [Pseudomonadota bacterium]